MRCKWPNNKAYLLRPTSLPQSQGQPHSFGDAKRNSSLSLMWSRSACNLPGFSLGSTKSPEYSKWNSLLCERTPRPFFWHEDVTVSIVVLIKKRRGQRRQTWWAQVDHCKHQPGFNCSLTVNEVSLYGVELPVFEWTLISAVLWYMPNAFQYDIRTRSLRVCRDLYL